MQVSDRGDVSLGFAWDPPKCNEQHGEITQYQYVFTGLDDWAKVSFGNYFPCFKAGKISNIIECVCIGISYSFYKYFSSNARHYKNY